MQWSWKLGRLAGIPIQVHWTFLILIGWVILTYASQGASTAEVAQGLTLVLVMFGCIVLHELGHAVTARRFGVNTKNITLLPIGGVAQLERMPEEPREEFLVAIAGPAVNVAIAAGLFGVLAASGTIGGPNALANLRGNLLVQLMWVNIIVVLFNLLPAFPMDGGRILRSLLAMKLDYLRATKIAAGIGQAMAIVFGFAGLFGNFFLLFIAIFVYLGAQAEAQQVEMRVAVSGVRVADAMMTRVRALTPTTTLRDAVHELLAGAQQDFPVLRDGAVLGMLFRRDLVAALKQQGDATPVADVMVQDCHTARADEPLHAALARLREGQCTSLPVIADGRLVGLLTLENVGELMMVSPAAGRDSARHGPSSASAGSGQ